MNGESGVSLTLRAAQTFIRNILGQAARFLVTLLVTPLIVGGLGKELYGAWSIIQQLVGYFSLSDLRTAGTMKFLLAIGQHRRDLGEKQRLIGSTLLLWVFSVPLMVLVGSLLVYFAPGYISVESSERMALQTALAIMIVSVVLDRLLSIPENILSGQNLAYKDTGVNALTILLGGGLNAAAIGLGWGIRGLAIMSLVSLGLTSALRLRVARRAVPWMALRRPRRAEFVRFVLTSVWLSFMALTALLQHSSDILLVGLLLGPAAAAVYLTTGSALRLMSDPISIFLNSANAGIAGLCGKGEWKLVDQLRREMHILALAALTVCGTGVLVLNQSFLRLWLGPGFFGGTLLNVLLVIGVILLVVSRIDYNIVSSLQLLQAQTWISLGSGLSGILTGVLLIPPLGMAGMAAGYVVCQAVALAATFRLLQLAIRFDLAEYLKALARPALVGAALLALAAFGARYATIENWLQFVLWGASISALAAGTMWFVGLTHAVRASALKRLAVARSKEPA